MNGKYKLVLSGRSISSVRPKIFFFLIIEIQDMYLGNQIYVKMFFTISGVCPGKYMVALTFHEI